MSHFAPRLLPSLAISALLLQGCQYRVEGTRPGPFDHGEGIVRVERLAPGKAHKVLHLKRDALTRGHLVLEFANAVDRVVEYETAWFQVVEVVERHHSPDVVRELLIAGVLTLTVILFPIGLFLFIDALTPDWSPTYGRVVPGEFVMRKNARVLDPEYQPLPPPSGAVLGVTAGVVDDPTSWKLLSLGAASDGRFHVDLGPMLSLAEEAGKGIVLRASPKSPSLTIENPQTFYLGLDDIRALRSAGSRVPPR